MKKLLIILLTFIFVGCNIFSSDSKPVNFQANVKFYPAYGDNISYDISSIKATIHENDGDIAEGTDIWVMFYDELNNKIPFRIPYPTHVVGIYLQRTDQDSVYDFNGWKSPNTIEFSNINPMTNGSLQE